jgi:hypothetical protein
MRQAPWQHALMSSVKFQVSDRDGFLFGLLANVVTLQWWALKPLLKEHQPNLDFADAEIQLLAAEQVVDLVIGRFGTTRAAGDMKAMRADLIQMVMDGMQGPTPSAPEPILKLVK